MAEPCIIRGCGKPRAEALKRGLCMGCHGKAKKLIADGKTTWENLEQLGLCISAELDPFTAAFKEKIDHAGN